MMRTPLVFLPSLIGALLSGCVYVPPVWDIGDEINQIEGNDVSNLKEGVATREDVLDTLGDPKFADDGASYTYVGERSGGFIIIYLGFRLDGGFVGEERWSVKVSFDEGDFVETIGITPNPLSEPEAWKAMEEKAARGDPEAQYQLGRWSPDIERLEYYCLAANGGLPVAQYHMGRYFETALEPDFPSSYLWHSLAAQGDLPASQSALDRLAKIIPKDVAASVARGLGQWQADQETCYQVIETEQLAKEERDRIQEELNRISYHDRHAASDKVKLEHIAVLRGAAEQGGAKEQFRLGRYWSSLPPRLVSRAESAVGAWYWTCLAANSGHPGSAELVSVLVGKGRPRPTNTPCPEGPD